jgi:hypothetical protein
MARTVTIDLRHAVYDTYNYRRGADLSVDPDELSGLLMAADAGLDRDAGGFFETIDDRFVLGFEDRRSEGTKGQMGYFELFTMPVDQAERVDLVELIRRVKACRVGDYDRSPEPTKSIRLPARDADSAGDTAGGAEPNANGAAPDERGRERAGSEAEGSDPRDDGSNPRDDGIDPRFVAEMWEQIRHDEAQCRARIGEVERFVSAVDGALRAVSYLEQDRRETDYFDVIGTQELERRFEPHRLVRIVSALDEHDRLSYDALPTYREELRARRRRDRAAVRDDEALRRAVDDTVDSFNTQLVQEFDRLPRRAAELMEAASDGELAAREGEEDDDGLTSRLTGFVQGDDDGHDPTLVDPEQYPSLDPETVAAIDAELDAERRQVRERVREELIERLERGLLSELDEQSARIAREAVSRLDETNRSTLRERAGDPDR